MVGEKEKMALQVAGTLFLLIAMVHLLRVILGWDVIIGGFIVPLWFSVVAALMTLALSVWMFKSAR
ncbi:MAG: hypothetical protein HY209_04900 [Candidatus Omnitrophica bacterium]|nr:hypothetical protein [Candidatus Omnitrophota bacterium]